MKSTCATCGGPKSKSRYINCSTCVAMKVGELNARDQLILDRTLLKAWDAHVSRGTPRGSPWWWR